MEVKVPHEFHVDGGEVSGRLTGVLVNVGDVLSEAQVSVSIWFVLHEPEQIEAGEERGWQLNVLLDALPGIVAAVGWVGCSEDGTTGVEGRHDTSLERKRQTQVVL